MARNQLRLYITADGDVAVKTFKEVGEASGKTANQVEKDAKKQSDSFALVEKGSSKLRGAVGALMGTVGLGGLAFGIADVVKAGEQWQLQQAQLVNALKNVHDYSAKTAESVRKSAESLSTHGGFAGPEELQAINQFIRLTGSATRAVQLNKDATLLARGTNIGYTQAQRMIGQVLTGNTGRLQRYLGIIQPVKTAEFALTQGHAKNVFQLEAQSKALGKLGPLWLKNQEIAENLTPTMIQHAQLLDKQATATEALSRIQEKYGNSTQTFSKTTAGAVSNLRNSFDLLGETIGRKVLPVVTAIIGFLSQHTTTVLVLTGSLTALAVVYGAVTAATAVWGAATAVAATASTVAMALFGTTAAGAWIAATAGVVLLIPLLILLVSHFRQVKAIAIDVFHWILTAAATAWTWIKGHWVLVGAILMGPFGAAIAFIITHLHTLVHAFESVFHTIVNLPVIKQLIWLMNKIGGFLGGSTAGAAAAGGTANRFQPPGLGSHFGSVIHKAAGGLVPGSGIGDTVPAQLTPGEFVLQKSAVQTIGVQSLNSINAGGSAAGIGGANEVYVAAPIRISLGGRIAAETVAHFAAKKGALSGAYVSG